MSQKDKSKKRDAVRRKKAIRLAKREKRDKIKRRKLDIKVTKRHSVDNLVSQLQQQDKSTFDRSAFQALTPPDNISHGSVRSAVLNYKTPEDGFNKNAWGPPDENTSEAKESVSEPKSVTTGFNLSAWAPPDGKNTEAVTTMDTGECAEGTGK